MTKSKRRAGSMVVAFILAMGVAGLWQGVADWCWNSLTELNRLGKQMESISLAPDGEPLIVRSSYSSGYRTSVDEMVTLDGQPRNFTSTELAGSFAHLEGSERYIQENSPSWSERLAAINDGGTPETYWYLVDDGNRPGRVYGIGYHSRTKLLVGYFGKQGFSDSLPPVSEWFEITDGSLRRATTTNVYAQEPQWNNSDPNFLLLASDKLWLIDLQRRQVKSLADCPEAYSVGTLWKMAPLDANSAEVTPEARMQARLESPAAARSDGMLTIVNRKSGAQRKIELPTRLHDAMLSGWQLADGQVLVLASWYREEVPPPDELLWFGPDSKIVKEQRFRLARNSYELPITQVWWENIQAPIPLAKTILFVYISKLEGDRLKPPSYAAGFAKVFRRAWLAAFVLYAVCVIPAWAAYRRQKRFNLPNPLGWAVFVYVMGIPGWIAYRFHRAWPVLEECPACHQPSPRDRQTCLDCGKAFPPPPPKGIEVFA
ncbi:MAG TPA: hypothetical protein VGI40_00925 [Pirellulaceae bacterium]|jgi:hypothetical protein